MSRSAFPPWHALHYLPRGASSVLDIGCNVGEFLQAAHGLGVPKLFGIDINPEAALVAKQRLSHIQDSQIKHGSADQLPFASGTVDAAFCTEVLEHIPEELRPAVIQEAHRVLHESGWLILTVPAAGLFASLDPANLRLRFPGLFRVISRVVGGRGREAGYANQKHGIVWHHHFTLGELRKVLEPYFRIERVRYRGSLIVPICNWLQFPFYRRKAYDHPLLRLVNRILELDMACDLGERIAYNVIVVARKVIPSGLPPSHRTPQSRHNIASGNAP